MRFLPCILILSFPLLCFHAGFMECRSINIEFSHQFKYAVDDIKDQESVNLDQLSVSIRKELEDSIKQYREKTKVIFFEIPENQTSNKVPPGPRKMKKSKNVHLVDMMLSATPASTAQFIDTPLPPIEEQVFPRRKRSASLSDLANKNIEGSPMHAGQDDEWSEFEVVSQEDLVRARRERIKGILRYMGITLAAVVGFSVLAFCFINDPKACVIAFGTGCPCCLLICPCVISCLKKFLTPGAIVRDNTNKYMPGVIVHPDGKMETYDPSPEEIQAVRDIISIIKNMV